MKFFFIMLIIMLSLSLFSTIYIVDENGTGDFLTVQAAVNNLQNGGEIIVKEGSYDSFTIDSYDNFIEDLYIHSEFNTNNPSNTYFIENTIIDAGINNNSIEIIDCQTDDCKIIIEGFSIKNGHSIGINSGHGIFVSNLDQLTSEVFLNYNFVFYNESDSDGGGIYLEDTSFIISNCLVHNNVSENRGAGIYSLNCDGEIINCEVSYNSSSNSEGGGICMDKSTGLIEQCNIHNNSAYYDAGGIGCYGIGGNRYGVLITNNEIHSNLSNRGSGIGISADQWNYTIQDNSIYNNLAIIVQDINGHRLYASGAGARSNGNTEYFNNIFYNNTSETYGGALTCGDNIYGQTSINNCLFYSNTAIHGAGIVHCEGTVFIENCSITNNLASGSAGGIYIGSVDEPENLFSTINSHISNCIIYQNSVQQNINQMHIQDYDEPFINDVNLNFSCIESGLSGISGDIDKANLNYSIVDNPLFVDPLNGDYNLTIASPCIDFGDPTTPFDPDGTVADMGCYYFHHDYDIHQFDKGIKWLSFPRLDRDINEEEDLPTVLNEITPFLGIRDIDVYKESDLNPVVYYDFPSWSRDYGATSEWLYKVDVKRDAERILTVNGDRLSVDHTITGTVPTDQDGYCWLGYWVPYPQSMKDAFGDGTNNDFWQYVEKVKSEDWFYSPSNNQRGDGMIPVATSPNYLRLEYGKGYMVKFNTAVQDFQWNNSLNINSPVKRTKSESFLYTEKPDYEAIDFVDIPSSIIEIGVYQGDLCVGAVVVDDSIAQVLVYPQETTRNASYFTFNFIVDRGNNEKVTDYCVFNPASGIFEQNFIIPGNQDYSIVSFSNGSNTNDTPGTNNILLSLNYPNPFNPNTTIKYSLSEAVDHIDLSIFNSKGQKINTLYSGSSVSGNFKYIWDGRDINGNPVSSGIYMYKLESGKTKIIKKMLLMK